MSTPGRGSWGTSRWSSRRRSDVRVRQREGRPRVLSRRPAQVELPGEPGLRRRLTIARAESTTFIRGGRTRPMTHPASMVRRSREIERQVTGQATSDGAGVRLTRVLTHDLQRRLDPFLMLDAFGSDDPKEYIAGFPDHPHRGFETVTYMLAGRIRHRDSAGHEGVVSAGGVQWMTAARGVVHSEMPEQENGLMQGFQLWLNLSARDKMSAPTYRDIPAAEIPTFTDEGGVRVKVIAGEIGGVTGAVSKPVTEPVILDVELPADRRWAASLPTGHNAFVYVYVYEGVVE